MGSPPRMRGKGYQLVERLQQVGITPAHAGKRQRRTQRWRTGRDHPRACGEKVLDPFVLEELLGSPPRMRGKGCHAHNGGNDLGITPAHAGKRNGSG